MNDNHFSSSTRHSTQVVLTVELLGVDYMEKRTIYQNMVYDTISLYIVVSNLLKMINKVYIHPTLCMLCHVGLILNSSLAVCELLCLM